MEESELQHLRRVNASLIRESRSTLHRLEQALAQLKHESWAVQKSLLLELEAAELEHEVPQGGVLPCSSTEIEAVLRQQLAAANQQVQDEIHRRDLARQVAAKLYGKLQQKDANHAEELQSLRDQLNLGRAHGKDDAVPEAAPQDEPEKRLLQQRELAEAQFRAARQVLRDELHILNDEIESRREVSAEAADSAPLPQEPPSTGRATGILRDARALSFRRSACIVPTPRGPTAHAASTVATGTLPSPREPTGRVTGTLRDARALAAGRAQSAFQRGKQPICLHCLDRAPEYCPSPKSPIRLHN